MTNNKGKAIAATELSKEQMQEALYTLLLKQQKQSFENSFTAEPCVQEQPNSLIYGPSVQVTQQKTNLTVGKGSDEQETVQFGKTKFPVLPQGHPQGFRPMRGYSVNKEQKALMDALWRASTRPTKVVALNALNHYFAKTPETQTFYCLYKGFLPGIYNSYQTLLRALEKSKESLFEGFPTFKEAELGMNFFLEKQGKNSTRFWVEANTHLRAQEGEKEEEKRSDEVSKKRKLHHVSRGEKKVKPMEESLDPLKSLAELVSDDTNESIVAFKGATPAEASRPKAQTPTRTPTTGSPLRPKLEDVNKALPPPPQVAHTSSHALSRIGYDCYKPYVGPPFDLRRDLLGAGISTDPYRRWEPCAKLKSVPLIEGNSSLDPNLGLHLLNGVCPPIDRTPLSLERDAIEGLVRQTLSTIMSQFIPAQLKMGQVIMGLTDERDTNVSKLQKAQATERELERVTCRLAIEEAARKELEVEVAQKEQLTTNLREAQKRESTLVTVVEKLQKEALTAQNAIAEAEREVTRAKEEMELLKIELPKRLEESATEAIETFRTHYKKLELQRR